MVQASGWPSVVTCVGNWWGKGLTVVSLFIYLSINFAGCWWYGAGIWLAQCCYLCGELVGKGKVSLSPIGLKLRVCIEKLIFLFLNQNICCGYSKELS